MKVAIIGSGNMGGALARGLVRSGALAPSEIFATATSCAKLDSLKRDCGNLLTSTDNREAVKWADCVVIAVKPWIVPSVAMEIGDLLGGKCVVSMAASHDLQKHIEFFGNTPSAIIRAIPNTAIEVGEGVTFLCASEEHKQTAAAKEVERLFAALGYVMWAGEKELVAGMALASCGIAYALKFIKSASDGGVELGLRPQAAREIAARTVAGAAALLKELGSRPEEEIDKVTTPGGLTIKGLNAMEAHGFTGAVLAGIRGGKE